MSTSKLHLGIFLYAANLRHGTDGFTSPPKEGVLRIFSPLKIRRLQPGLNPRTRVLKASTLTPRPLKPLSPCLTGLHFLSLCHSLCIPLSCYTNPLQSPFHPKLKLLVLNKFSLSIKCITLIPHKT